MLSDGLLDVVIVKKTAKPFLLYNLIKQILAGKLEKMETSLKLPVIYFQTKQLSIENTVSPLYILMAILLKRHEKLKIKIVPNAFGLFSPFSA